MDAKAARASRAQQAEGIYGALSEADARIVFSRLAAALAYLHDHCQMVHRDVKLENVLVDKGGALGSVRLADFGFTVPVVNPKTRGVIESGLKGTLEYASPEVLVAYLEPGGDASDASRRPPVDMFSLGVTLFIMLGVRLRPRHRHPSPASQAATRAFGPPLNGRPRGDACACACACCAGIPPL